MFKDGQEGKIRKIGIVNLNIMKQRNEFTFSGYKPMETKKVKQHDLSSDLAERNMSECRRMWRTERGSRSSHGRSL
jgi:hypothetical protein